MAPVPWRRYFQELGLRVCRVDYVDCPWWPDIINPTQMLADFFPFLSKWAAHSGPEQRYRWEAHELPYFLPELYPDIHQKMEQLAFFEDSRPIQLKMRFAHHVGILAEKS
jgi:hypothetical protein